MTPRIGTGADPPVARIVHEFSTLATAGAPQPSSKWSHGRPRANVRGQAFIASATGMADAATTHKDSLIAEGLPATILDDITAAIAELEMSMGDREMKRTQRVGATKGLAVEQTIGQTILSVLEALVKQALGAGNEALMRQWQSAPLVRRSTANTSGTPAPTTGSTPTATSHPTSRLRCRQRKEKARSRQREDMPAGGSLTVRGGW